MTFSTRRIKRETVPSNSPSSLNGHIPPTYSNGHLHPLFPPSDPNPTAIHHRPHSPYTLFSLCSIVFSFCFSAPKSNQSQNQHREETKNNNNGGSLQRQRQVMGFDQILLFLSLCFSILSGFCVLSLILQLLDDSILLSWLPSLFWV